MARGIQGEESYTPQVMPEDLPRKIVPRMEGSPVGGAITDLANSLQQKGMADAATWAGDQLAAFRQKAVGDLEAMKTTAPAGDPGQFTPQYLAQFDKNAQALTQVPFAQSSPIARSMIERGVGQLRDTLAQHSMEWEAQQRTAYQADSFQQNLQGQLPLVRSHPEITDQVGSTLTDQATALRADPLTKYKLLKGMDQQLTRSAALGKVDQNPGGVYQQLQLDSPTDPILSRLTDPATRQEVIEAATHGLVKQFAGGVLDAYRTQGPAGGQAAYGAIDNLTVDKDEVKNDAIKDQVRREVQTQRGEMIAENQQTHAQDVIKLEESLKSGQPDPTRRGMIWGGYHNNWLSPEQTGAMLGEDDRISLKGAEDQSGMQLIQDAYDGKVYLNPKDPEQKKDANNWFIDQVEKQKLPIGSQQYINLGAEFAHRTGVIPEPVMDWSRAVMISSPDPQSVYQAALALDRMRAASPRGFEYADDDHKLGNIADSVLKLTKAGMPVDQAVTTARENYARGQGQRELMDEKWKVDRPFGKNDEAVDTVLKQQVADDPALTKAGWLWGRNPLDHPIAMQSDFDTLVRSNYAHNGGNAAQAEADAARDIGNKWGITTMNGEPEIVKYPPERMFRAPDGGPGLTAADIRTDLQQHIEGDFKDAFQHWDNEKRALVPFKPVPSNVKLVSIPGVTETSGGVRWGVLYDNGDGHPEQLYDKKGAPITYELPIKQQDYSNMKQRARDEAVASAKQRLQAQEAAEAQAREQLLKDQSAGMGAMGTYPGFDR